MSQDNNTADSRKYKHLTTRERYKIEILTKEGRKPFEIAQRMGKGIRTIEKEKAKGKVRLLNHDLTSEKSIVLMQGRRYSTYISTCWVALYWGQRW